MISTLNKTLPSIISLGIGSMGYAAAPITFNGEEILFDTDRESISFTTTGKHNGITLEIDKREIKVSGRTFPESETNANSNFLRMINPESTEITKIINKESLHITKSDVAEYRAVFLKTGDSIEIDGHVGAIFNMVRSEVKNHFKVTSPFVNTSNFFVTTEKTVEFSSPSTKQSWLESIVFTPFSSSENPSQLCFDGTIKLSNPETFMGPLVVFGAQTITFKLKKS